MIEAFIGVGSNLGDRKANLLDAVERLSSSEVSVGAISSVYESAAILVTDQPDFLNIVVKVTTTISPEALLSRCLAVEEQMGRVRHQRWGSRNIDLDLLLYDNVTLRADGLDLPHPGVFDRPFVLVPLLEIAPDLGFPSGELVASLVTSKMQEAVCNVGRLDSNG